MPDVVEQGRPEPSPSAAGLPPIVRALGLLVAAAVVAFLLSRSGLLSAQVSEPPDGGAAPAGSVEGVPGLVAQADGRLVVLGRGGWGEGAKLPPRFAEPLVPVPSDGQDRLLAGLHDGGLFRVATGPDSEWERVGPAVEVIDASSAPGRVFVHRRAGLLEVDVRDGTVSPREPFPGFDPGAGWSPYGLVSVLGTRALLMTRAADDSFVLQELALAWPARRVEAGTNPAVQVLGVHENLLGTADDWVLVEDGRCPGTDCRTSVVTVTRDAVLVREVRPPEGWVFVPGPSPGRTHEALVPVRQLGDQRIWALARLIPGGDNALLVGGTEGFDLRAGVAETLSGDVYLQTVDVDGQAPDRVRLWRSDRPARAEVVPGLRLPEEARLVCACG